MWLLYLKKEEKTLVSKHQVDKHKTGAYVLEKIGSGYLTSVFIYHFPLIMNTIRRKYKIFGDLREVFSDLVLAQKSSTAFSQIIHPSFCLILCLTKM